MIRNIKVFGLALVAVFAMSAVVASAASANAFMSEGNVTAAITANQIKGEDHVFSVEGNKVECETAKFATSGEVASPTGEITVHPTYSGCTAFSFVGASVTTTGCDYTLKVGGLIETGKYNGKLNLTCSGSNKIVISAGPCEATVSGPQEFNSGITYTNAAGGAVTVGANVSGIKTNKTKDGFLCPFKGTGETTGTYTGGTNATGTHSGAAVNITVEGTEK
jgi:hypothetical protein